MACHKSVCSALSSEDWDENLEASAARIGFVLFEFVSAGGLAEGIIWRALK
jgi:hypothetical protein